MNVVEATGSYERWANSQVPLLLKELEYKHSQMDKAVFPFLRATFYRWIQLWAEVLPGTRRRPGPDCGRRPAHRELRDLA
jgi:hypothetical protein